MTTLFVILIILLMLVIITFQYLELQYKEIAREEAEKMLSDETESALESKDAADDNSLVHPDRNSRHSGV